MATTCDPKTIDVFRSIVGKRLKSVAAQRYTGYLAYSQIIATFSDNLSFRVDLAEEAVAPKFEVFVVRARNGQLPEDWSQWDRFEFGDFIIASVFVLRRKEWIEESSREMYPTVGRHAVEQRFGSIDNRDVEHATIVDSGFRLVSTRGAELSFDADTFPLVLQLRYKIASSPLPLSSNIALSEY